MKKRATALAPCVIVLAVDFYLLPALMRDTGSAMLLMLCVMPLAAFIVSVVYGAAQGFDPIFPLLAAALFVPAIFIYYNHTAWEYAVVYGVIALAGELIGWFLHRRR